MSDVEEEVKVAERLERFSVPAMDELLGKSFPVLDKGFIRVVDYMGGDPAVVQAARTSYGKGTKKVLEDRGLLRFLMRHSHTTPFEMAEIKLHVKVPMDHWRQWIRHRTASVNEYSTRYSIAIDDCQGTACDGWRSQSTGNRQGSGDFLPYNEGVHLSNEEADFQNSARKLYESRIAKGVAREQARKDLPLSTYTEAYWKTDLHNLFHFLALRMDKHAQLEIRSYADIIGQSIVKAWCPISWEAFVDYRLKAMKLTRLDAEMIALINTGRVAAMNLAHEFGWLEADLKGGYKKNREREEFEAKAKTLCIDYPWKLTV